MGAQLSNGYGIVAIEGEFAVAYDASGEKEIGRIALPASEEDASKFLLVYLHGRDPISVTATAFVKQHMMVTRAVKQGEG